MNPNPLKTGPWRLTDLAGVKPIGRTVFSCFHCGGGSTMGYKLAGYDVLGGVEIDPQMMAIYRANHQPRHSYLMGVQEFKKIPDADLPPELFNLDILDGSPPCSSFSMAGSREKAWGDKKKFREGQAEQVLDDLFFDFIAIAEKLKPKVVVAENVKGLIQGAARGYVKEIFLDFNKAGYDCQLFLLNASRMGVPQRRERTFFLAKKKTATLKPIRLIFDEPTISVSEAATGIDPKGDAVGTPGVLKYWHQSIPGTGAGYGGGYNTWKKLDPSTSSFTQQSTTTHFYWSHPNFISDNLIKRLQTFPDDYAFGGLGVQYVCGMSVPPFMMQRVATQIHNQWFQ